MSACGAGEARIALPVTVPTAVERIAAENGATIVAEPKVSDYGEDYWSDKGYECVDPGGHHWWFAQRLRDPKPSA